MSSQATPRVRVTGFSRDTVASGPFDTSIRPQVVSGTRATVTHGIVETEIRTYRDEGERPGPKLMWTPPRVILAPQREG